MKREDPDRLFPAGKMHGRQAPPTAKLGLPQLLPSADPSQTSGLQSWAACLLSFLVGVNGGNSLYNPSRAVLHAPSGVSPASLARVSACVLGDGGGGGMRRGGGVVLCSAGVFSAVLSASGLCLGQVWKK